MNTRGESERTSAALSLALQIVAEAWEEVQRTPYVQRQLGFPQARLPDLSEAEAQRRSAVGRSLLKRLETLDESGLAHELQLTLRLIRFRAQSWARESEGYWLAIDAVGTGFFGLFLPSAYCGGQLLNTVHTQLALFPFRDAADTDRYLALIDAYARLIEQFAVRTLGQAERGMRMPKVQVQPARALLTSFRASARKVIAAAPQRLQGLAGSRFSRDLEQRLLTSVEPAFDRALQVFSDEYLAAAPDTVGLHQYEGGEELYEKLVRFHTTLDVTPEQVHERGLARMEEIASAMASIRAELGFRGDRGAFDAALEDNIQWRANTVEGVTARFERSIERIRPHLHQYFSVLPKAPYSVAPLPEALQGSMTFGYYDSPRPGRDTGLYLFNAANLTRKPLHTLAALIYHELVPGHHLHRATQRENSRLHPLHTYSFVNAYQEGWAEYAATFAGEIGMYEAPEERYGRLTMDAFLTCRLVVDTGMNVLGWPLERARDYLRAHSGMSEAEVQSESVRYACDIPAQSLAYKLGDVYLLEMRGRMRHAFGTRFELKDFHSAILGPGALPLPDLEWHVGQVIERATAEQSNQRER